MTRFEELPLAAVVLCGGGSERMGRSKALLDFGGESLLQRVVRLVSQAAHPVVVSAAADQDLPGLDPGVLVVRDSVPDRGPLQGLADGLAAVGGGCHAAFVCTCDAPFIAPAYVRRLAELLGRHDAVVPLSGERRHTLSAVYRISVAVQAGRLLERGGRRMRELLDMIDVRFVTPDAWADLDLDFDALRNVNTPEEYRQALDEFKAAHRE